MGKYKHLLSNTAVLGIGTFASKVLVFLLMPFYTSILSSSEFGVADIMSQTANLLIPLAAVGICDGIARYTLDVGEGETLKRKQVFSSGIAVLAAGSLCSLAVIQLLRLFDIFDGYVFLIALYVIFANVHSAFANFIRSQDKTGLFALQGIINTVLTILLNLLFLVVFDMGAYGYVLSVVVADLLVSVFLLVKARLYRELSFASVNMSTIREMLRYSLPYIPTTMMWLITSASDRYIVTAYCGSAENGLYAAAYKLPTLIVLVCGVFIEAWHLSSVKDASSEERAEFFGTVFKNYMAVIFMGGSVLIAGARILTDILLSNSFYPSWKYVPMLVLATVFSALVSFMGSVYFLEKKSVMSMLTAMAGALINVVLNFVAIPRQGALGAALATFISYLAVYVIRARDTKTYVDFDLHTPRVIVNTAVLTAQMIVMTFSVRYNYYIQLALVLFMLVFNGREIVVSVLSVLKNILKKSKKV